MGWLQRAVLLVGLIVFAVMGAFPPWVLVTPGFKVGDMEVTPRYRDVGYAPIYDPPVREDWFRPRIPEPQEPPPKTTPGLGDPALFAYQVEHMRWEVSQDGSRSAQIDMHRLGVQWAVVFAVTVGSVVILRRGPDRQQRNRLPQREREDDAIQVGR